MIDAVEQTLAMDDHTAAERLVYLQLRESGRLTASEIADRIGISEHGASGAARALEDNGWVSSRTRMVEGAGRNPTEWQSKAACECCGEQYHPSGVYRHEQACDDSVVTSDDLDAMDPEDLGLGGEEKPEPNGGLR